MWYRRECRGHSAPACAALWIAIGCLTQLVAVIIVAVMANTMFLLVQAPLFAVLSAVLQAGLAMAKPGSMGFGDVTCTLAMGLAVGMAGLTAWWSGGWPWVCWDWHGWRCG